MIYREICDQKLPWDTELTRQLAEKVKNWEQSLPTSVTVPRAVIENREPILDLELHAFGDASTQGVGTAVYAVVRQSSGTTQHLVAAKGRLSKQGLTVPRLELIAAHMARNLGKHIERPIQSKSLRVAGQYSRVALDPWQRTIQAVCD